MYGKEAAVCVYNFNVERGRFDSLESSSVDGGIPISKNLGAAAEEMRAESAEWTKNYLTENPEIAGYLKWIEEEPITRDNWWHSEIFQRSLAQAAPSMATMIATDLMLMPVTGGVGALVPKVKTG